MLAIGLVDFFDWSVLQFLQIYFSRDDFSRESHGGQARVMDGGQAEPIARSPRKTLRPNLVRQSIHEGIGALRIRLLGFFLLRTFDAEQAQYAALNRRRGVPL